MTEPFNVLRSYHDLESRIKELEDLVLSRVTGNRQEAPVPVPAPQSNLVDFTRYQVTAIHRDSNEVVLRTLGFREVSPHLQVRQGVYMAKFPAGVDAWPTPKAPQTAPPPHTFTRTQISNACIRVGVSASAFMKIMSKLEEIVAEEQSREQNQQR